jgi:HAE1 family hydrophobic/amphiphilic exporter-1
MNFIDLFVKYRVFAIMLNIAIVLFGGIGLLALGVDRMPDVNAPYLVVETPYPGATPAAIDSSVTSIIESSVNSISGVERINSSSMPGSSRVFIQFSRKVDMQVAFNDVQSKINKIANFLPEECDLPVVSKVDPNALPVMWIFMSGDRSIDELTFIANRSVKRKIENINGVGRVLVNGGKSNRVQVAIDEAKLLKYGLGLNQVYAAISAQQKQFPGGFVTSGDLRKSLNIDFEFHDILALRSLIVASYNDSFQVTLGDIAEIDFKLSDNIGVSRLNGEKGVAIAILKVEGANTIDVVKRISELLDSDISSSIPEGIAINVVSSEDEVIERIINSLQDHLIEGTILAAFVVWLFLLNGTSTFVVVTSIPISLAGAIIAMYFSGFTLNVMTMSGLLILIGVVVDDAIVVIENIDRHLRREGEGTPAVIAHATKEVVFSVFAASLTLVCIFGAVIFIDAAIGEFLKAFAIVIVAGVATSLLVSLSLTPALSSLLMLNSHKVPPLKLYKLINSGHEFVDKRYRQVLQYVLSNRILFIGCTALLVIGSGFMAADLPSEFFPEDDESRFIVELKAPPGVSVEYMLNKVAEAENTILVRSDIKRVFSTIGYDEAVSVNEAEIRVFLVSKNERDISQKEVVNELRKQLINLAGVEVAIGAFPAWAGGSNAPFEVYVTGDDLNKLAEYSEKIYGIAKLNPELGDLTLDLSLDQPNYSFILNRRAAQLADLSISEIAGVLSAFGEGYRISMFNDPAISNDRYDIVVSIGNASNASIESFNKLYFTNTKGERVPFRSILSVNESVGASSISRLDMNYSVGFFSYPSIALDEAVSSFRKITDDILPPGYKLVLGGQTEEMQKSSGVGLIVFGIAMLLVYMVLASQFDSIFQPLLIMTAQPLAIVGGIAGLWIAGASLNVYSMIGMILLIGLVSKNSILLVDLINRYKRDGKSTAQAIQTACPERMRPILMTSMTVVLAMAPAAFGTGDGAGEYGPLSIAVLGGTISSTLLTLLVVPVSYSLFEELSETTRRWYSRYVGGQSVS